MKLCVRILYVEHKTLIIISSENVNYILIIVEGSGFSGYGLGMDYENDGLLKNL